MLYDPKWTETETDPLSLESLIAWLEKMPPRKHYDYNDCQGKCLYGLYMAANGVDWEHSGACSTRDSGQARADFCSLVYDRVASQRPWTFGAALIRARAALTIG